MICIKLINIHQWGHPFTCMTSTRMGIGVDLGGSPGTCPPIIEKRPCVYIFHHLLPPIFWFAHPIFLTSLRQCGGVRLRWTHADKWRGSADSAPYVDVHTEN